MPAPARSKLLEITIISAQELPPIARNLTTYAVAWLKPDHKLTTPIDHRNHTNPEWNHKLVFHLTGSFSDSDYNSDSDTTTITFEIYNVGWLRDFLIGSAQVLVSDLVTKRSKNHRFVVRMRRPMGVLQGILNVGVNLIDHRNSDENVGGINVVSRQENRALVTVNSVGNPSEIGGSDEFLGCRSGSGRKNRVPTDLTDFSPSNPRNPSKKGDSDGFSTDMACLNGSGRKNKVTNQKSNTRNPLKKEDSDGFLAETACRNGSGRKNRIPLDFQQTLTDFERLNPLEKEDSDRFFVEMTCQSGSGRKNKIPTDFRPTLTHSNPRNPSEIPQKSVRHFRRPLSPEKPADEAQYSSSVSYDPIEKTVSGLPENEKMTGKITLERSRSERTAKFEDFSPADDGGQPVMSRSKSGNSVNSLMRPLPSEVVVALKDGKYSTGGDDIGSYIFSVPTVKREAGDGGGGKKNLKAMVAKWQQAAVNDRTPVVVDDRRLRHSDHHPRRKKERHGGRGGLGLFSCFGNVNGREFSFICGNNDGRKKRKPKALC